MLTLKHIKIYEEYGGDGDMLIRIGSEEEKGIMNYEHWKLIDELIQDLELVEKGLASESFTSQTIEKLNRACDSKETENELKSLVRKI